jgi:hypothetical protein
VKHLPMHRGGLQEFISSCLDKLIEYKLDQIRDLLAPLVFIGPAISDVRFETHHSGLEV